MAKKVEKKKQPESKVYTCSECGREISGNHVYIKTKRRTALHIHYECMPMGRRDEHEG